MRNLGNNRLETRGAIVGEIEAMEVGDVVMPSVVGIEEARANSDCSGVVTRASIVVDSDQRFGLRGIIGCIVLGVASYTNDGIRALDVADVG